jgi:hypothetical protein
MRLPLLPSSPSPAKHTQLSYAGLRYNRGGCRAGPGRPSVTELAQHFARRARSVQIRESGSAGPGPVGLLWWTRAPSQMNVVNLYIKFIFKAFILTMMSTSWNFFSPPTCVDSQKQEEVLNSLSITMQHVCVKVCTFFLKTTHGHIDNTSLVLGWCLNSSFIQDSFVSYVMNETKRQIHDAPHHFR